MTYATAKFEVATSNLGVETFTEKTNSILAHEMLPSTLYIMRHMHLRSL